MNFRYLTRLFVNNRHIPLRWVLVIPFALQTVGAVALVGYLSYRSGQEATENLASQLLRQTSERVSDRLINYLHTSQDIVATNRLAVKQKILNLNDPEQLRRQLWQQIVLNRSLPIIGFSSEKGNGIGYVRLSSEAFRNRAEKKTGQTIPPVTIFFYEAKANQRRFLTIDSQGRPGKQVYQVNDDFRTTPWYRLAKRMSNQGWTPVSIGRIVSMLQIVAVAPVDDAAGKLPGFFTAHYMLPEISSFLNQLHFSPTGQVFIIERSGNLIASSASLDAMGMKQVNGKVSRLSALTSQDDKTRAVSQQLLQRFGTFNNFQKTQQLNVTINGQRQFVQVTPYQDKYGLDWLVVTLIPESDFMAQIYRNTYTTVLLCLVTLVVAIASGTLMANRFSSRIHQLKQISQNLAAGDLTQRLPVDSAISEVTELGQYFNLMADRLEQSFDRLHNAIEESEEKFTTIFRTSPDPIAIVNLAEGKLLEVNNQMVEFYGYSREEFIGRTALELGLWADLAERQQFRHLLETQGYVYNQEAKACTKSGEIKIVLLSAEVCNLQGQDVLILNIRNITDRKKAEERLKKSEAHLKKAQEIAQMGHWEYDFLTKEIYWSEELYHIHGIDLNQPIPSGEKAQKYIHPDQHDKYQQEIIDKFYQGKSFATDLKIFRNDGSIRFIETKGEPIFDAQNQLIGFRGTVQDITDRKLAEIALQESELKFATIFLDIPEPAWIGTLAEGRCIDVNESFTKVLGFSRTEAIGKTCVEMGLWNDLRDLQHFRETLRQKGNISDFEVVFRTKSGEAKTVLLSAKVSHLNDRDCVIGTLIDISDRKQTEISLQQALQQLTYHVESSPLATIRWDQKFRVETWSKQAEKIFGWTLEEVSGKTMFDWRFIFEDDLDFVNQTAAQLLKGISQVCQNRNYHKDGSVVYCEWYNSILLDEKGNLVSILSLAHDISDRKRIEAERQQVEIALRESETLYRVLSEVSPVAIFQFDTQFNCLYVNDRWSQMTGRPKESALGHGWMAALHPDEREEKLARWSASHTTTAIVDSDEGRHLRPDGTINWYYSQIAPEIDATGQIIGFVGSLTDITDRKQVEEALRESEERLRLALEAARMGTWDWNILTNQIVWSESLEQLMGLQPGTFDGRFETVGAMIYPDDRQRVLEAITRSVEQGDEYNIEFRFVKPNGSIRWAVSQGNMLRDRSGQAIRMLGVDIDITDRKLAEIALKESETRFFELSEASPANIYILVRRLDGSFYFEHISRAIETIHELSTEQVLENANLLLDCIHPEDRAGYERVVEVSLKSLQPFQHEWRMVTPSGKIKWVQGNSRPKVRENDIAWYGVVIDITDRKTAELALQDSEARLKEAQRVAQVGSWELDATTCESLWSEQMFRILGIDPNQTEPSYIQIQEIVPAEDRDKLMAAVERAIADGTPYQVEHRVRRPDGSIRYVVSKGQAILDEQQRVTKLYGTTLDITERKLAELALQAKTEELDRFFSSALDMLCIADTDGYFRRLNQEWGRTLGYSMEELEGSKFLDYVHPEDLNSTLSAISQLKEQKEIFNFVNRYRCRDGSYRWIEWRSFPFGNLIYASARDISDRKQAEEVLQQAKEAAEAANQAKSAFLATMSHELRTPLNVILGFAQLMSRDTSLIPEYQKYTKIIHSSGNYLLKLINEILDLSKIEAGKFSLENLGINLFDLLQSLHTTFSQRVSNKELKVNLEIFPEVPQYIMADPQKLQQVLINLIGNAIKFTKIGKVTLRVKAIHESPQLHSLRFEVEDTGVGIAPQDLEMIFDAFAQAPAGRQAQEGTGLGLTISNRLVQLMGGEITVSSSVGKGSIFAFTIPVQKTTETAIQPQQPKRQVTGLESNQPLYRILVVDDQAENRLLLVKLLEQLGLQVQEAASGEEALLIWEQWHPHLILMDLRMPGLNGYEATKQVRAKEQKNHYVSQHLRTIIIAITAQASVSDRNQAKAAGCDDYISKPFELETLFSKIAEHLGIRYTYAEDSHNSSNNQTFVVEESVIEENLAFMPYDWVVKLHQASKSCQQKAVTHLIKQIPAEYSSLSLGLEALNQDFDFEKIMLLTKTYLDKSGAKD